MWELIESNKKKSIFLIVLLSILLFITICSAVEVFLLWLFQPENPTKFLYAGFWVSWFIFIPVVIWQTIRISKMGVKEVLKDAEARKIPDSPEGKQVINIVDEMVIASGYKGKPSVYIVDEAVPNAFAVGITEKDCAIVVTSGLLEVLNRDELQAVIAHEMAHLYNKDSLFMTLSSLFMVSIIAIASIFGESRSCSRSFSSGSGSKGNGAAVAFLVLFMVIIVISPFLAKILFFMTSRKREYLADACAVQFTRNPGALASALVKISSKNFHSRKEKEEFLKKSEAQIPLYINNPAASAEKESLFSTHPPIKKRIAVLMKLSKGSIIDYEKAYSQVFNKKLFSKDMLKESVKIGNPLPKTVGGAPFVMGLQAAGTVDSSSSSELTSTSVLKPVEMLDKKRIAQNLVWESCSYKIINCDCGTTLKIPPIYFGKEIHCPHCGVVHIAKKDS